MVHLGNGKSRSEYEKVRRDERKEVENALVN